MRGGVCRAVLCPGRTGRMLGWSSELLVLLLFKVCPLSTLEMQVAGEALHLSEGVKKMWLCTILPLHLTNSNLLKCKFTFLILELLYFDLPSRTSVIPKVCFFSWWNNITVPPSCLFYAPAPHLCENQCIFFVCLDHEHRIGRLNCRAWQLCVRETLH